MLSYKSLLPTGVAGRKDNDLTFVRKAKSRKDKVGKKGAATTEESLIPGLAYARELGLSGSPVKREAPDIITQEILKEGSFLPRRAQGLEDREFPLRSQISFPEGLSTMRVDQSGILGMGSLNYSPMKLHRVYGRTDTIPVLNLTGLHKSHIAYVAANVIVFFDYYNNRQSILQGHKNKITCMVKDRDNRFFASGDTGKESLVIIWDIRSGYPYKRIPASYEDYGVDSIGFVGSEDYIGTIGTEIVEEIVPPSAEGGSRKPSIKTAERQVVNVWYFGSPGDNRKKDRYTGPAGKPVVSTVIPPSVDRQREIQFSEEIPEYFMTTGDKSLVFYTWIRSESRIIHHIPKTPKKFMNRMRGFSKSIWVTGDRCFTCTAAGFVLEFGVITPLGLQEPPNPNHNIKEYRRSYKVGELPLTTITAYKEFFVVGDHLGNVQFFDEKFRIIRWTKSMYTGSINSISFNITEAQPEWKVEMQSHYEPKKKERIHAQRYDVSAVRDYTAGGEKYVQPSQTTIERPPLFAADIVVGYAGGNTYYYHLAEGKADQLIHGTFGQIVAIDTCPFTTHITMSNKRGEIQMYDYLTQALLYSGKLFKKKLTVTYLKFHPSGSFAFFGTTAGHMYFRRSYTWRSLDTPLEYGNAPIEKIVFSSCGVYVAHYDIVFSVTLYFFNTRRSVWLPKGKYRAHCRPIIDMAFLKDPTTGDQRLFSLGQDRRFIEYDVYKSNVSDGLKILNISYVDQSIIPTSMVFEYPWPQHGPLVMVATNTNKIKVFDQNFHKTRRTVQGPNYGTPINRMISIAPEATRNSTFIVMLLGNKIGLMKTPVDGNPFKSMAVLGHGEANNILEAVVGCTGREVFTCAEYDSCTFMWLPNIPALETCALSGGSGVLPYKHMLDAGLPPGKSVVEDIENVFYHMMMKRALTQHAMLSMSLTIHLSDIPTVMRTCGFFPTEYEIEAILEEAEFMGGMKRGEKPLEISMDDFIVLFANHRTFPVSDEDIVNAFTVLGMFNDNDELSIMREDFVNLLTTKGESFNALDIPNFLPTFYRSKEHIVADEQQPAWLKKIQDAQDEEKDKGSHESSGSGYPSRTPSLTDEDGVPKERGPTSPSSPKTGQRPAVSSPPSGEFKKPDINPNVAIINMTPSTRSLMYSEDTEGLFYGSSSYNTYVPNQELPEEITAKFFIDELLTAESRDTMTWAHNLDCEAEGLSKIFEATREVDSWDEILNRWKGRDEWRYFNRIFELFRRRDVTLDKKLEAAMEMDYYCRNGTWPEPRKPKSEPEKEVTPAEEEEGELEVTEDEGEEDQPAETEGEAAPEVGEKKPVTGVEGEAAMAEELKKKRRSVFDAIEAGEDGGEYWSTESDDEDMLAVDDGLLPVDEKNLWLGMPTASASVEEIGEGSYLDEEEENSSPPFSNLPMTISTAGGEPYDDEPGTELYTDTEELQLEEMEYADE